MSSEDVTDFAALISQYEATEHDMLNNLDAASAADSSAAKSSEVPLPLLTSSNPRRNAPSFSDSDDSDDDESDTGNDDTSYTAEDANEAEENTETSYTEGNEDGGSDNDSSESEEWESDGDEEDQSSQPSYTEEGTSAHSDDDDDDDDGSHDQSPSAASKSSARSLDPDGSNATSTFEEFAPMVQRRKNAPVSDSDESDSENQSHTSYTEDDQNGVPSSPDFISPVSIGKENKNLTPKVPQRRNTPDGDSDSDSDNASYEYVEEEIHEGGNNNNTKEKPDSVRSYESYETADSEGKNDDGSASFYESGDEDNNDDGDEGSVSFYDSADDSGSNDDDDSDSDSDSDSSYTKDSEDDSDNNRPSFNQRGDSNHGFQHPSIADNPVGDDDSDSDSSGWDDTGDLSRSESANDEEFENEPFKASILGGDDNIEIESDSSESGFEDEPRKTKKKKGKGDSSDSDSSSDSSSGSDSSSDSSDSSENDFEDEDHTIDVYDGEEALSLASSKRKKKRGSTNLSSTDRSAELEHIISREKIVVDRENTVNTRERKFTRWFIIAAGIVLLGAIILLSVYFTRPGRTAAPTPSTVVITIPTDMPVTIPIGIPATPTTPAPTPLPANKVIVDTSFLAFVRDGKTSGLTTENLESELQMTMGMFLPGLLTDVADSVVTSARRLLRRLQNDKLKIDDSIGVDVSEIGKSHILLLQFLLFV